MSLPAGTKLGPYEIQSPLGAGGMGEVYRARDTRLERTVAIKVLPNHLSSDPESKQRFEREARAVSSLNHPHICALYDVGHQDGIEYLVMEYLEGETLAARIEKGPLPSADLLRYASQIADALDKAHRQGMVHRDLKPGNVMLTKTGAKLLDFGLARVMAPAATGSSSGSLGPMLSHSPTVSTPLTAAGAIVGTFQYMAPEQLEGQEAAARVSSPASRSPRRSVSSSSPSATCSALRRSRPSCASRSGHPRRSSSWTRRASRPTGASLPTAPRIPRASRRSGCVRSRARP